MPYGCGEQNMLNFVPNIVVLEYLTNLGKLTPEIEAKCKQYMEVGYQKELTYMHDDGSYSAFGKSDKHGSTWLTAFVARSFKQAAKFIHVDHEKVTKALDFLAAVQADNGSFPEVGHVSHKDMQGGSSDGIALTAYTLITFLENRDNDVDHKYQTNIDKALKYVLDHVQQPTIDTYSLAIAAYALQLAKHSTAATLLSTLESKAETSDGSGKFWTKDGPHKQQTDDDDQFRGSSWLRKRVNSVNVEMSAYALQALLEAGRDGDAVPVMKWLVTQRNANGGFESTQDTVVGLQALSKLAAKIYVPDSAIEVTIKTSNDQKQVAQMQLNAGNALVLQKHELPSNERRFEVAAAGRGFSIVQLSYRYNIDDTGKMPRFTLQPELLPPPPGSDSKEFLQLRVCTAFVPDATAERSNMAVMEVSLPSGFTFDSDSLQQQLQHGKVKKVETKDGDTVAMVYFDDIDSQQQCPEFKAYRTHAVAKQKPSPVVIYDYYDNTRHARSFYTPPAISLCDICQNEIECRDDCEVPEAGAE